MLRAISPPPIDKFPVITSTLQYYPSDLPNEIYDSFEFGVRDLIANSMMIMANVFYTGTKNEFYARKNDNPILDYSISGSLQCNNQNNNQCPGQASVNAVDNNVPIHSVYDKTRRLGVEVAMEQYFYGGILAYESFSYVKAQYKDGNGWSQIPYTYDYKATIGVNVELFNWLNLWTNNSFYGKQEVPFYDQSDTSGYEKLKSYFLTDIGITMNIFNATITAGVRNVADTYYYDYYNRDIRDPIVGYGYLIGQGRTYFIEGRYTY